MKQTWPRYGHVDPAIGVSSGLEATGGAVTAVAAGITTPEGRAKVLAACPNPDMLANNAAGPPRGHFRE